MSNVSTKELIHTYVQLPSVFRENFKELRLQAKISLIPLHFQRRRMRNGALQILRVSQQINLSL